MEFTTDVLPSPDFFITPENLIESQMTVHLYFRLSSATNRVYCIAIVMVMKRCNNDWLRDIDYDVVGDDSNVFAKINLKVSQQFVLQYFGRIKSVFRKSLKCFEKISLQRCRQFGRGYEIFESVTFYINRR